MNPDNWPKVKEIFDRALARPASEREAFVHAACAGDEAVRQEVESLLRSYEDAESFMETPAVQSAARSLAGEGKLSAGQQITHYAIQSLVGEGGMGQVYLAQDLTLKRKVALKVLPADVAGNADRMRRFRQEATSAAALNHPNIAHIYQVGEDQGVHFIAMEYVDGITLRQLIHERRAELPKLLRHLQHVAEGLSRAHTAGIVHRDLKPDNIMVSRDGHAKILDFGLAKLVQSEAFSQSGGPAETAFPRSMPGAVLGTAGYMSPEQAQGKVDEIDQRSDIFSFGCILFEAVTRQKAFAGKDLIESLNKIIREPPPSIAALNPSASPDLHRIVRRCLAKDPEDRYQTIKEVAIEIKEVRRELDRAGETHTTAVPAVQFGAPLSSGVVSAGETLPGGMITPAATDEAKALTGSTTSAGRPFALQYLVPVILVLLLVAGGVTLGVYLFRPDPPSGAFQKSEITQLTTSRNLRQAAISPDGKYIAYAINEGENESLWVRQANASNDLQIVPPNAVTHEGITFSRDSLSVYYSTRDQSGVSTLYRIPAMGGTPPQKLIAGVDTPVTFSPDGASLAFVRGKYPAVDQSSLMIAGVDGSHERILASHRAPKYFFPISNWTGPSWSPDGEMIACAVTDISSRRTGNVYTYSVKDGSSKQVLPQDFSEIGRVEWLADMSGLVMVGTEKFIGQFPGQIFFVSYPDGATRRITNDFGNYRALSLTSDGSKLVTISFNDFYGIWVAPDGDSSRARQVLPVGRRANVSWTPDGRIVYATEMGGHSDVWIMNADGTMRKQLTSNAEQNIDPAVSPDGKFVALYSTRNGWGDVWRIDIDGGNPRELTRGLLTWQAAWTPDSQWILFLTYPDWKIWKVPVNGGTPMPVTDRPSFRPAVSPDGKWLACFYSKTNAEVSTGTVYELAVVSLDGTSPPKVLPFPGGRLDAAFALVRWSPDGRAILYNSSVNKVVNIWSQPVDGGKPKQVTDFKDSEISSFAWSRDGRSLALTRGTLASDAVMISQVK